jgi:hypothetical protein
MSTDAVRSRWAGSATGFEQVAAQPVFELAGGAVGDHVAGVDDEDPVCEPFGLFHLLVTVDRCRRGAKQR